MTSKTITVAIAIIILAAIGYYIATERQSTAQGAEQAAQTGDTSATAANPEMVGTWISTDDAKFSRTFRADGTVTDTYEGEASATETGTYTVVDPASEANFPAPVEALSGATVIRIDFESGPMYFSINSLTDTSLEMTNISGRGNILSFTRAQ